MFPEETHSDPTTTHFTQHATPLHPTAVASKASRYHTTVLSIPQPVQQLRLIHLDISAGSNAMATDPPHRVKTKIPLSPGNSALFLHPSCTRSNPSARIQSLGVVHNSLPKFQPHSQIVRRTPSSTHSPPSTSTQVPVRATPRR